MEFKTLNGIKHKCLCGILRAVMILPMLIANICRDLLMSAPQALAPVYIDLLADSEKWIRYVCSKELELIFEQDFPLDHLNPQNNAAAIKKWREWHQNNKNLISKKYEAKKAATGIGASIELEKNGIKIIAMAGVSAAKLEFNPGQNHCG